MWCGILALGVVLIAVVILWGRRLRRANRRQPAASTSPDPFWYLKKKPVHTAAGNRPDVPGQEASGSAESGDPRTP
jgi:hypothetical protein